MNVIHKTRKILYTKIKKGKKGKRINKEMTKKEWGLNMETRI